MYFTCTHVHYDPVQWTVNAFICLVVAGKDVGNSNEASSNGTGGSAVQGTCMLSWHLVVP